jgi:hypothetical protein
VAPLSCGLLILCFGDTVTAFTGKETTQWLMLIFTALSPPVGENYSVWYNEQYSIQNCERKIDI